MSDGMYRDYENCKRQLTAMTEERDSLLAIYIESSANCSDVLDMLDLLMKERDDLKAELARLKSENGDLRHAERGRDEVMAEVTGLLIHLRAKEGKK